MFRRTTILTATLLLATGVLAGCGSSDDDTKKSSGSSASSDSYCGLLKSSEDDISAFTSNTGAPDLAKFDEVIKVVEKVAAKAPDEVSDDWKVITDALDSLTAALDDAGTNLQDVITAATTGKLPDGVTQEQLVALGSKLTSLQSGDLQKAGDAITANAKSDCNVDLKK
jgi:ABC-type glycerol-3-phosphate transport system substrate-binding protein